MNALALARQREKQAYDDMQIAFASYEAAIHEDAPEATLNAREAVWHEKKSKHDEAVKAATRQEELAEARASLPAGFTSAAPDERDRDPDAPMNRVGVTFAQPKRGWDGATLHIGGEPATYQGGCDADTGVSAASWFWDQLDAAKGDSAARERILRSARELADAGRPMAMKRSLRSPREVMSERAINETAGTGGELVAPLYLQEEYLKLARAGRPYVNLMRRVPLPSNTNTINIPRLKTDTATAAQSDLGDVKETNLTTALLTFDVITVAGQESFARQLFDRSVPELADQVVFPDLIAAYITNTDVEALEGSGSLPHAKGVTELTYSTTSSTVGDAHEVTFTSASPTLPELYKKIANAVQQIHTTRYMPPTAIIMHPRRWAWVLTQKD